MALSIEIHVDGLVYVTGLPEGMRFSNIIWPTKEHPKWAVLHVKVLTDGAEALFHEWINRPITVRQFAGPEKWPGLCVEGDVGWVSQVGHTPLWKIDIQVITFTKGNHLFLEDLLRPYSYYRQFLAEQLS